jgi:hypothetical protein
MPTDLIVSQTRVRSCPLRIGLLGLLVLQAIGCIKAPAIVVEDLLDPLTLPQAWLPSRTDLAAADLAQAALISDAPRFDGGADASSPAASQNVEFALERLRALHRPKNQKDLLPLAIDLRNATLDDPTAYRAASRALLKKRGLDPRLRARLDRTVRDDPLRLAGRRQFDGWHRLWARTFNAVAEPLGSSAITGFVLAPYQLGNSLLHYFAEFSNSEPLSVTGRQALALREEFAARQPHAEVTAKLETIIDRDRIKLEKTLARRRVRAAKNALEANSPELALYQATAALQTLANHPNSNGRLRRRANRLAEKANRGREEQGRLDAGSLEALPTPPDRFEAELRLATLLLADRIDPREIATPLSNYRSIGGQAVATRVDFVEAIALHEAAFEAGARRQLGRVAAKSLLTDSMSRHARAILEDDWQNPYGAFERLRRKAARDKLAWRLAGEWVNRPRYPNLPAPIAYLVDAPTIAITIVLAPIRALASPWTGTPDFDRTAAQAGYRYLLRFPQGEEMRPVVDWLYEYESGRERWGRALRMADWIPEFDEEKRLELVEKTAAERLARIDQVDRRDTRASTLRGIAQEFPDSDGGQLAGLQARSDREEASPQHIRITRDFLFENPSVAGPEGIGLNAKLLNKKLSDGELHPDGVILRGGLVLEILLVAEGADDDARATSRIRKVSKERLMRIAVSLDEAVRRNSMIDVDARQRADASRDLYLERAGLGLTEEVDARPAAESTFVYQSLRERYGMVRGRESVLPFDLVFRGNMGDFSLGAFPRWRTPKETPDSFLYR